MSEQRKPTSVEDFPAVNPDAPVSAELLKAIDRMRDYAEFISPRGKPSRLDYDPVRQFVEGRYGEKINLDFRRCPTVPDMLEVSERLATILSDRFKLSEVDARKLSPWQLGVMFRCLRDWDDDKSEGSRQLIRLEVEDLTTRIYARLPKRDKLDDRGMEWSLIPSVDAFYRALVYAFPSLDSAMPIEPRGADELSKEAVVVLKVLFDAQAFDVNSVMSKGSIKHAARGKLRNFERSRDFERAKDELKAAGLILYVTGSKGGFYLTDAGKALAETIRANSRSETCRISGLHSLTTLCMTATQTGDALHHSRG